MIDGGRTGALRRGDCRPLHDTFPNVFTQRAIHTIAVKFSYWFR